MILQENGTRFRVVALLILTSAVCGNLSFPQGNEIFSPAPVRRGGLQIDCDFPGGNIVVDRMKNGQVWLHQDRRDTPDWWFYWYFRVRGGGGQTLRFHFTDGNVIGEMGPAVSLDGGRSWEWLGTGAVEDKSFLHPIPEGVAETRFAFAMPYVESNLQHFLRKHLGNPHLRGEPLCETRKGRKTEVFFLGQLNGKPDHRVVLTARHHSCETIASYVLDGIMAEILAGSDAGPWLREHVEFLVVPFMDKDGVQDGDQGKNRKPHDHNRDYDGDSIYPSVQSLKERVPQWSGDRLRMALDLHCPWIRGKMNDEIYFVGVPDATIWNHTQAFSDVLETVCESDLPFRSENNLPHGQGWNTDTGPPRSCATWMATQPGILVATTIEHPYAKASGVPVTVENARAFGRDLARAVKSYLQGLN